jgi:hypothetical protein
MIITVCPPEAVFQRPIAGSKPSLPTWNEEFFRYSAMFEVSVSIFPMPGRHPPSPVIRRGDSGNTTLLTHSHLRSTGLSAA